MRIAVISDIHSNMDALSAVGRDMDQHRVDRIISLGDSIGYGPEPEKVIEWLRRHQVFSVMGNHERALLNDRYLSAFNPGARKALLINREMLSAASLEWIRSLASFYIYRGARFVHGLPPDMVDTYITRESDSRIIHIMTTLKEPLSFVGHTHSLGLYCLEKQGLIKKKFEKTRVFLAKGHRYIISTGSVGQPRDGYNKAKYVIWDSVENHVEPRFVRYDVAAAVKKILAAGIPKRYAAILEGIEPDHDKL